MFVSPENEEPQEGFTLSNHRRSEMTDDPATSPTLPGWAYTDPELFEREKSEIFYKSWQYAGWIGDLSEPGDYITAEIIDQSVLIIRGADAVLRGFHNVCQHRGHQLATGCGRARALVCPYHAWSYRIEGQLRTARGLENAQGFDTSRFSLKPVKVDVLGGKMVFFNLDPEARPLQDIAAGLEQELLSEVPDFARLARVERVAAQDGRLPVSSPPINANWKVVVDNCLECYHCRPIHPAFSRLLAMDDFQVRAHDYWASLKGYPRNPEVIPSSASNKNYRFWWLWPNTFIEMAPGGAHGFTIGAQVPMGIGTTGQGKSDRYGVPGAPLFEPRGYGNLNLVPEDRQAMESVQRGIRSLGYSAGRFSFDPMHGETNEAAVHRFQRLVSIALGL